MTRSSIRRETPPRVVGGSPLSLTEVFVFVLEGGSSLHVEATYARDDGTLLLYRVVRGAEGGLPWADLRALEALTRSIVSESRRSA